MKRVILVLALLTAVLAVPFAQSVRFGGLNLNASGELLFTASADMPGMGEYSAVFLADIPVASMKQLTVFPERISVVSSTGAIQVQNRFGLFRTGAEPSRPVMTLQPVSHFPAFVQGNDIQTGKTITVGTSPDGRFMAWLAPTSPGYGELRLYDTTNQKVTVVSSGVELTLDDIPLRWSGDSSFFVYSRNNELYYFSIKQHRDGRTLNESLRRVGPGTVWNVTWDDGDTLYYVRGSLVYRIRSTEFFTRSLYQQLLKIGTIVGKLPDAFDPNFDRFWISPDGNKVLLSKDGRNLTVFFLKTDDFQSASPAGAVALPYLYLPRNTRVQTVLWSPADRITVLTGSILHGETTTAVYRLNLNDPAGRSAFLPTTDNGVRGIALSPDGTRALVWTDGEAQIRNYTTWETDFTVAQKGLLHGLWQGNTRAVLAGRSRIERVDLNAMENARKNWSLQAAREARELVAFSSVEEVGFAPEDAAIRITNEGEHYELRETGWTPIETFGVTPVRVAGAEYRVYLENLSRGSYANMVMVRSATSFGTVPLFPRPRRQYEPFPERDQVVDLTNFSHGSRIRRREVALVFNAVDSVAGLTEILNTLVEYDIRATFFLNGDFIRRHPGAVREIAASGHEVGNLFFTYFDLADGQFQIDSEFVKQGLARNEDDFFEATGRELSLLWHAPYYFVNPVIIAASREMNYAYIGRDVDSLDWIPRRDENGLSRLYKPAADIIETVLQQKKPGSIIAMTVGKPGDDRPDGGRDDYLFHRLDVLLNGLIERGYDAVTVSTLMDNAR